MDRENERKGYSDGETQNKEAVLTRSAGSSRSSSGAHQPSDQSDSSPSTASGAKNGYSAVATVTGAINNLLRKTPLGKQKKCGSAESLDGFKFAVSNESLNMIGSPAIDKNMDRRRSGSSGTPSRTPSSMDTKEGSPEVGAGTSNLDPRKGDSPKGSVHSVTFSENSSIPKNRSKTDIDNGEIADVENNSESAQNSRRSEDSSSRASIDMVHNNIRERSFEKSLNNILDKCTETSMDMSLGIESRESGRESKSFDEGLLPGKSGKSGEKKKKSSAWYTMLSPTYKSRSEDFRKLFKDVPHDERLVCDYSCAMQKEILVHGRLFVTQNWICFYANIFRWETVVTIQMKEVAAITKEKTARVIPNALQITTENEKYFFTSFGARDKTFMMLFRLWQNALMDQEMSPKELWHWVHCSYGDELGLTSSDDDYVPPPSMEDLKDQLLKDETAINKDLHTDSSPTHMEDIDQVLASKAYEAVSAVGGGKIDPDMTDGSDTTEDDDDTGEVVCSEHEHLSKLAHNEVYNLSVDKMFELIFTETPFARHFATARRLTDMTFGPWQDDPDENIGRVRTVTYTVPLSAPFGPKHSQTIEKQLCYTQSKPGVLYVIDAECSPQGIPYADAFYVMNRYCMTRVTRTKSRLRVTSEVRFKKSVWMVRSMIERNSIQGVLDYFQCLGLHLRRESDKQQALQGIHPQHSKKKLRKRRSHTQRSVTETPVTTRQLSRPKEKPVPPPTPIRSMISTQKEEKLLKMNADTLIRIVCFILVLLVMFNALLFYKLWSLETLANVLYFPHSQETLDSLKDPPKSQEEWLHLLKQQRYLHESEMDKWREVLGTSVQLVDQMRATLVQLKETLDKRHPTKQEVDEVG